VNHRPLRADERHLLDGFLYLAIHVPPGADPPPRGITASPELAHYVEDFGHAGDIAVAAENDDGQVVGIAWSRVLDGDPPGYGNVGPGVPELSVAVVPEQRGQGIGTALVGALLDALAQAGLGRVSLSVQKTNPAAMLYRRLGFVTVRENTKDLVMVKTLG
jgi:ribosomal protein S18 acetylase RimI-like enzyme